MGRTWKDVERRNEGSERCFDIPHAYSSVPEVHKQGASVSSLSIDGDRVCKSGFSHLLLFF